MSSAPGGAGGRGFDILSLISCFSAAWRLTLMHCKDAALTAWQHIHVRSALAQESSGLRVIHSEEMKWEWACPAAPRTSRWEIREIKRQPGGETMRAQSHGRGSPSTVRAASQKRNRKKTARGAKCREEERKKTEERKKCANILKQYCAKSKHICVHTYVYIGYIKKIYIHTYMYTYSIYDVNCGNALIMVHFKCKPFCPSY